jgi:hypothetical protein
VDKRVLGMKKLKLCGVWVRWASFSNMDQGVKINLQDAFLKNVAKKYG